MNEKSPLKVPNDPDIEVFFKEARKVISKQGVTFYRIILREKEGIRDLLIFTEIPEMNAILNEKNGIIPKRPATHDLIRDILLKWNIMVVKVIIVKFANNMFYAEIVTDRRSRWQRIDSRPSDAIAIALRFGAPIFVKKSILDRHGIDGEASQEEIDEIVSRYEKDLDLLPPDLKNTEDEP